MQPYEVIGLLQKSIQLQMENTTLEDTRNYLHLKVLRW